MKKLILSLMVVLFLAACAPPTLYYWDDYSVTLYELKSEPSDEHLAEHIETLQTIIAKSKEKNMRVAPGICGELGFWLAKSGKTKEAITYFEVEKQTYPESQLLMDSMIAQANASLEKG